MVRSRFGTPRIGKNGSGPSKIPEQYRFSAEQPGTTAEELTIDGDFTSGSGPDAPPPPPRRVSPPPSRRLLSPNNEPPQQAQQQPHPQQPPQPQQPQQPPQPQQQPQHPRQQPPQRPDARHIAPPESPEAAGKRVSRAERRRAAEQSTDEDDYATTHSADLSRIASFLRSTQQEQAEPTPPPPAELDDPHAEEKTSELPTVTPDAPTSTPVLTSEAVLSAVRQVPGVAGARLNEADNKLALEIADGADTDAVHRDVVAVLDSHLGVRARPAKAPVAAVEPEPPREPQRPPKIQQSGRVMLERTQVITSGFESTVEVGLTVNGTRAVGRASGPAVDRHILRSAAEATVDAVGVLVGKNARVVVESATITETGAGRVAVVLVLLLTQAGSEQLAGAAPVDSDRRQAVVHATLQALNRRLETMLT
ncbi:hypothetical protein [Stackebrandtia nassauensis]|nr:hypothetical protein [Stackebrandtia nassauensis]